MKLPYHLIFPNGGAGDDAEIDACGITASCMRFFFACIDFPHTFFDAQGERVELSDVERQLLESGVAALSRLECPVSKLIARYYSPLTQTFPDGGLETLITLGAGFLDGDYVVSPVLPGTIDIVSDGLYSFDLFVRVEGALTPVGEWNHQAKIRVNGALLGVDTHTRVSNYETLLARFTGNLVSGDRVEFIYEQFSGADDVVLQQSRTLVTGVYLA